MPILLGLAGAVALASRKGAGGLGLSSFWASLPEKLFEAQHELIGAILKRGNWEAFPVTEQRVLSDGRVVTVTVTVTNAVQVDGVRVSSLQYPYAQQLADELELLLPTPRIADMVHRAATVSYPAESLFVPLSKVVTAGCPRDKNGNLILCKNTTKAATLELSRVNDELGQGAAGLRDNEGKWFVLSKRVFDDPTRSGIYGWWLKSGRLLQTNIVPHELFFSDYSQVLRFVGPTAVVQIGQDSPFTVATSTLYTSPEWAFLVSDEGPLPDHRHPDVPKLQKGSLA